MNRFDQNQEGTMRGGVFTRINQRMSGTIALIVMGLFVFSVVVGAGCSKHNSITGPNIPQNNDPVDPDDPNNPPDNNNGGGLSFFEEQLVGLWSRYHSYDGSTMYVYFDGDRTACKWEEANGSEHRTNSSSYSNWYIDESNPIGENRFRVIVEGAGITYTYDYPSDNLWPSSYSNLSYHPSSESKSCQY